jgi:hypothetical protein
MQMPANLESSVSNRRHSVAVRIVVVAAAVCATAVLATRRGHPDPLPGVPRLVLWAWERPEHLPFLDPNVAGVAFLARTIRWQDGRMESRPRLQPLSVPPETRIIAVVRLESGGGAKPDVAIVARGAAGAAAFPNVRALQVDFDAKQSERQWYRDMLARLRGLLPSAVPLEITALASWCQSDDWMNGLPVADAVPMLFRMGAGEEYAGSDFRGTLCRESIGLSTDESPAAIPRGRRLFLFHPRPWTEETYRGALQLARRWR